MKVSERGQVTIPAKLRKRYGLLANVEVECEPADGGVLIRKRTAGRHPVDDLVGVLHAAGSTDEYLEEIRGR